MQSFLYLELSLSWESSSVPCEIEIERFHRIENVWESLNDNLEAKIKENTSLLEIIGNLNTNRLPEIMLYVWNC